MIPIAEVFVGKRMRHLDGAKVAALVESIRAVGLIHPICVTAGGTLVAGLHRLEAAKTLGWRDIPSTILQPVTTPNLTAQELAEWAEGDENALRSNFTALEEAQWYALYLKAYPDTRQGGDHGNQHTGRKAPVTAIVPEPPTTRGEKEARAQAGKAVGVSARYVGDAKKVSEAAPELAAVDFFCENNPKTP
jgi:ParB family chromosome partitioning protein